MYHGWRYNKGSELGNPLHATCVELQGSLLPLGREAHKGIHAQGSIRVDQTFRTEPVEGRQKIDWPKGSRGAKP